MTASINYVTLQGMNWVWKIIFFPEILIFSAEGGDGGGWCGIWGVRKIYFFFPENQIFIPGRGEGSEKSIFSPEILIFGNGWVEVGSDGSEKSIFSWESDLLSREGWRIWKIHRPQTRLVKNSTIRACSVGNGGVNSFMWIRFQSRRALDKLLSKTDHMCNRAMSLRLFSKIYNTPNSLCSRIRFRFYPKVLFSIFGQKRDTFSVFLSSFFGVWMNNKFLEKIWTKFIESRNSVQVWKNFFLKMVVSYIFANNLVGPRYSNERMLFLIQTQGNHRWVNDILGQCVMEASHCRNDYEMFGARASKNCNTLCFYAFWCGYNLCFDMWNCRVKLSVFRSFLSCAKFPMFDFVILLKFYRPGSITTIKKSMNRKPHGQFHTKIPRVTT